MRFPLLFLAALAAGTVPGACQSPPFLVTLAGPTAQAYGDVLAVRGLDVAVLSRERPNRRPVPVHDGRAAFMRVWDGTGTLNGMTAAQPGPGAPETVTLQMRNPDGSLAPEAVALGGAAPTLWTLFVQNGAFSAESLAFTYATRQVVDAANSQ